MIGKLFYLLRRALRNMRQSPFLCTAAVGTVTVSLCILAFFAIIVLNVQSLTRHWSRDVQIVAYFESLPSKSQVEKIVKQVEAISGVAKVDYIDPRQAFADFKKRLGDDAVLLSGLENDFLPASLRLLLKEDARNRSQINTIVERLKKTGEFSDFRYGQEWLDRFESFIDLLRFSGLVLGGFLLFATLLIVANTIKLTIYARREELEIMSLVGGTPMFIKAPFLFEGAFQGAVGGALALGISRLLFKLFMQQGLESLLLATGIDQIVFLSALQQWMVLLTGLLLGFFGSAVSLRRFARV